MERTIFGFKLLLLNGKTYRSTGKTLGQLQSEFDKLDNDNVVQITIFEIGTYEIYVDNMLVTRRYTRSQINKLDDWYWCDFINERFGSEDEDDITPEEKRFARSGITINHTELTNFIKDHRGNREWD